MSTSPPLWKTFLVFLAPMMLSNILQSLFGTINNIYLGQMIGVDALAAVSVFFPVMFFFVAFVMGLSSGATVLIGQAWGAGEPDKVRAVAGATLTVALLCATAIAVFGGVFSRPLLIALATPPDILEEASRALFADDQRGFVELIAGWPGDIRDHVVKLAFGDRTESPKA